MGSTPQQLGEGILVMLIYCAVTSVCSAILWTISVPAAFFPVLGAGFYFLWSVFFTLVGQLLGAGISFVFLDVSRGGGVNYNAIIEPAKDLGRYLLAGILVLIYVFLWTLLLIVPGIIKSISYSQTFFILRENPDMDGETAIRQSMQMMEGHKMDYLLLGLSFIGWILLVAVTCGFAIFFVHPYIETAFGAFYDELKKDSGIRQPIVQ